MSDDELDIIERGAAAHLCPREICSLVAEVRRLRDELARVTPFLAMHGACGYSVGPMVPAEPTDAPSQLEELSTMRGERFNRGTPPGESTK